MGAEYDSMYHHHGDVGDTQDFSDGQAGSPLKRDAADQSPRHRFSSQRVARKGRKKTKGIKKESVFICYECPSHPTKPRLKFRGRHELNRHQNALHAERVKTFRCRLTPKTESTVEHYHSSAGCQTCGHNLYKTKYNAAIHLRRQHFSQSAPSGKDLNIWPSMRELEPWFDMEDVDRPRLPSWRKKPKNIIHSDAELGGVSSTEGIYTETLPAPWTLEDVAESNTGQVNGHTTPSAIGFDPLLMHPLPFEPVAAVDDAASKAKEATGIVSPQLDPSARHIQGGGSINFFHGDAMGKFDPGGYSMPYSYSSELATALAQPSQKACIIAKATSRETSSTGAN